MRRFAMDKLLDWKKKSNRKPLILMGARQVGKTWLMKEFGKTYYEKTAYISFYNNQRMQAVFDTDFDIKRIIMNLNIESGVTITPENTLIVLDEIQNAPKALESLKYFCEEAPEYHVIAAGSLLGVALHEGISYPVGKVDLLDLYPFNFREFLCAMDEEGLESALETKDYNLIDNFADKYLFWLKNYYYTGGMPAVVDAFRMHRDYAEARQIQNDIVRQYEGDFGKHIDTHTLPRIRLVWDSVPMQLAKENKKFQISKVASGARFRDYRGCAEWLSDAGMVNICYCMEFPELPLGGNYEPDTFKLYFADTGLLVSMLDDESQEDLRANKNLGVYKGALYENMVGEALIKQGYKLFYYKKEDSTLEADFFIRSIASLIPVEVKAKSGRAKSMKTLITSDHYPDIRYGIKLSKNNIGHEDRIYTFPYFCTFLLKRFMVGFHAEEEAE